jgi:nucleoside triphosphate diphosphatase
MAGPEGQESDSAITALAESIAIMARLRAPDGCPWDREQTFDSIKKYTLEETYEVFDAIERRAWPDLKDELGDLLLQVLFYAQMASEARYFDIGDVAENLNAKLIRRHPHVFPVNGALAEAKDPAAVLRNWQEIKRTEKTQAASAAVTKPAKSSGLDDVPRSMPAVMEAAKLGSKAAKVGFDWPDVRGILAKVDEELEELRVEIAAPEGVNSTRAEEELGDLMLSVVHLARHLKVDPEAVLRAANAKFRRRFAVMERKAGGFEELGKLGANELEALWSKAKADGEIRS